MGILPDVFLQLVCYYWTQHQCVMLLVIPPLTTTTATVDQIPKLPKQQKIILAVCVHLTAISKARPVRINDVTVEYQKAHEYILGSIGNPSLEFTSQIESLAATGLIRTTARGGNALVSALISLEDLNKGLGEEAKTYGRYCRPIANDEE